MFENMNVADLTARFEDAPYISKGEQHDLICEVTKIKSCVTRNPERIVEVGPHTLVGQNFIVELIVKSGITTQTKAADKSKNLAVGKAAQIFWKVDPTMNKHAIAFAQAEIAELIQCVMGMEDLGDALAFLKEKGATAFEDEEAYAGRTFRLFSKPPKTGKDGKVSKLCNLGYESIDASDDGQTYAEAPDLAEEETAPEAPAVIKNKSTRRGAEAS